MAKKKNAMKSALKKMLKMPYYKNYAATSGKVHNVAKHEDAVEDILLENGFRRHEMKVKIETRDQWISNPYNVDSVPENTFIPQPCGTHNSPDFIVKHNNKLHFIECKSTSKYATSPMYNSGIPKPEYIYVYSAQKYDETTIYYGKHVLCQEDYNKIMKYIETRRRLDEKLNSGLKNHTCYGIEFYTRPMINHKKGKKGNVVKDYFKNPNRKKNEKEVIASV